MPVGQWSDSFCVTIVHRIALREINSRGRLAGTVVRPLE